MDNSKDLLLQRQILESELHSLNLRIQLAEKRQGKKPIMANKEKPIEAKIKESTETNSLPKTQTTTVNAETEVPKAQNTTSSPIVQAVGKDIPNPEIPVHLEKIEKELQNSLGLRPSTKDPVLFTGQLGSTSPKYFVVFNGPQPGIYTNKDVADSYTKSKGIIKKAFHSLGEAQRAALLFTTSNKVPNLDIIQNSTLLEPKISFALGNLVKENQK